MDLFLDKKGGLLILTVFGSLRGVLLRFYVEKLKDKEFVLEFSEPAENFSALEGLTRSGECRFSGPVSGKVRAFMANGFIEVEGQVDARVRVACSRCLQEVDVPLQTQFALTFGNDVPVHDDLQEDEIELSPEEMGLIPFEGDEIDLRDSIQEQIIMELPLHPLCKRSCRGLCPHCGIDLNEGGCDCNAPIFNNKFAALKNFKVEK